VAARFSEEAKGLTSGHFYFNQTADISIAFRHALDPILVLAACRGYTAGCRCRVRQTAWLCYSGLANQSLGEEQGTQGLKR
jgi:hypothetical protein